MSKLSTALIETIPPQAAKIWVGYSGGIDSTALLHALHSLPQYRTRLTALHIHHGLSPNATLWQEHCTQQCKQLSIPFIHRSVIIERSQNNLEETARRARYQVFEEMIQPGECLVLGHHQADQAETILLRLFRGAGIEGLSGMAQETTYRGIQIIRPFLSLPKEDIIEYALTHALHWIEDESNENVHFRRNFLRKSVLPLIKRSYPAVEKQLLQAGILCEEAQTLLNELLADAFSNCLQDPQTLSIPSLLSYSYLQQKFLLRQWLKHLNAPYPTHSKLTTFLTSLHQAGKDKHPKMVWGTHRIERHKDQLKYYRTLPSRCNVPAKFHWHDLSKPLHIWPYNLTLTLKKSVTHPALWIPSGAALFVQFRQGGETLRLNQQTKKLKKLFQQWDIPHWQRPYIPLLYVNEQLAVVGEYVISDEFISKEVTGYCLHVSN